LVYKVLKFIKYYLFIFLLVNFNNTMISI
jgi:hypothetical protein